MWQARFRVRRLARLPIAQRNPDDERGQVVVADASSAPRIIASQASGCMT
jgi:hypothetical protein